MFYIPSTAKLVLVRITSSCLVTGSSGHG